MSKKFTHRVSAPFVKVQTHYDTCQHWTYTNRKLHQCGAPTESGSPTCSTYKAIEATGSGQARRDHVMMYVR